MKEEHEKLQHRRECEDFLYEKIEKNITLKRLPLVKQKKYKEEVRVSRADYTFLQYGYLIRKWATRNYNITPVELDMLLYLYPLTIFSTSQFVTARKEVGMAKIKLKDFNSRGLVTVWSTVGTKKFYILSHKITILISRMHRMYMLEEKIPMSVKNVVKRSKSQRDKKLMDLFAEFNKNVK